MTKETTYPIEFSKTDEKTIIKLFKGTKKDGSDALPISKIVGKYEGKVSNTKRQVMRVLHNNNLKVYKKSSLV